MKSYLKDILKEIFKSRTKFFALFIITLLGISTFIGLNTLSLNMKHTIDTLYNKYNVYDIKITNNLGISEEDIKLLSNNYNIENIEYTHFKNVYLENEYKVVTIREYPKDISKLNIIEGAFTDNINEAIIEYKLKDKYKIGDIIKLKDEDNIKITGYFDNVEYQSVDISENAFIGYGKTEVLLYTTSKYFINEVPNIANIKLRSTKNMSTYSKEYSDEVFKMKLELVNILNLNLEKNLTLFKNEKLSNINEGYKKINEAKLEIQKNENKLKEAKNKIENGSLELLKKENDFFSAPEKLEKAKIEIEENESKLNEGLSTLLTSKKELLENKSKLENGLLEIENGFSKIEEKEKEIILSQEELDKNKERVDNLRPGIFLSESTIEKYENQIIEGQKQIDEGKNKIKEEKEKLLSTKKELMENLLKLENGLKTIEDNLTTLEDNKLKLEEAKSTYKREYDEFYSSYSDNLKKISDAKYEINKNRNNINEAFKKLDIEKTKANKEIKENLDRLNISVKEINSLKSLSLIQTRLDNPSYFSYIESINAVNIISKFFPAVFLLIVILVTTTTMTRMVDEQRGIIGTYKFLGYNNMYISLKYIIYSMIPTILGIIVGTYLGIYFIPKIIYKAYSTSSINTFKNLFIVMQYKYIGIGILVSILTNVFSVYYSLKKELNSQVSNLLRPKVLVDGSKILFERITIIWDKLKFFNKLTIRNLFRYKLRMLMNILGIVGCTSLIFFVFGLKNSISEMPNIQFNSIIKFDAQINLKSYLNNEEINNLINEIKGKDDILKINFIPSIFKSNNTETPILVYVVEDLDKLKEFSTFYDEKNKVYNLDDNGIIISERALSLLKKNIGDNISIKDYYGKEYNFKVNNTFKNYFSNYIYMSRKYYESLGYEYKTDSLLFKTNNSSYNYNKILENPKVQYISLSSQDIITVDRTIEGLNSIVIFMTILSGMLAIVVTYSLLEINVNERNRELATIKVLGYYSYEVSLYIYRELFIVTLIGILVGFLGGKLLHYIILASINETRIVFVNFIGITPFIYSSILSSIFSIISMLLIHRKLSKIDMVEALKME